MNSIFKIYESLLGKTSDKVKRASLDTVAMAGNEPSSDLRRYFGMPNWVKDPFSVDGNTLVVNLPTGMTNITPERGALSELIGNKFNKLRLYGLTFLSDMNVKDIIHTDIEAENIRLDADCTIEDVNIKTIPGPNKHYPDITLFGNTVRNTTFEIDYSKVGEAFGYIRSVGIPTFINVKSDTVPGIRIESPLCGGEPVIKDQKWEKIFEFGYKLGHRTSELDKFRFTTIKSMDDLHKLVKSKQFRTREYDQFPYRLKKGVKITDFLDVSQFKNLKKIVVVNSMKDMIQITFEKVDSCSEKDSIVSKYPVSILIKERKEYIFGRPDLMLKDVPVTADGWRVLINGE
jgi:hypothetical protein